MGTTSVDASRESPVRDPRERASKCVVVAAHCSSGSKRLLRILDQSPVTHIRSEPYNCPGSPFASLRRMPASWIDLPESCDELRAGWDAAAAWAHSRMGPRDCLPSPPKRHQKRLPRALGLQHAFGSRRLRRLVADVGGVVGGSEEWPVPPAMAAPDDLSESTLVMKFNQSPQIVGWLLRERPDVSVVHLIRHPAAYLNSGMSRRRSGQEAARRANIERLRVISDRDPHSLIESAGLDRLDFEQSELLFWVYANTRARDAGSRCANYMLVRDEDVVADASSVAAQLAAELFLEWPERATRWLSHRATHWTARSTCWTDLLDARQADCVRAALEMSDLDELWDADQRVSHVDYRWR